MYMHIVCSVAKKDVLTMSVHIAYVLVCMYRKLATIWVMLITEKFCKCIVSLQNVPKFEPFDESFKFTEHTVVEDEYRICSPPDAGADIQCPQQ